MTNRALEPLGRWRWVPMALAIQTACVSAASIDDLLDMSLEELVDYRMMSMSRKEQRVADMAAAAYVISAEEIRRSGAQSIPEALRLVPGLNVAQISGDRWAVSSRGFNERWMGAAFTRRSFRACCGKPKTPSWATLNALKSFADPVLLCGATTP